MPEAHACPSCDDAPGGCRTCRDDPPDDRAELAAAEADDDCDDGES